MKKFIFLATSILGTYFLSLPLAQADTMTDVVGKYQCSGTNFMNNKEYHSNLNISQTNQTYQFSWKSADGTYKGTGLFSEDPSLLVVAFKKNNDPSIIGTQIYKVSSDGSTFQGKWVIIGKNAVGSETCQRTS